MRAEIDRLRRTSAAREQEHTRQQAVAQIKADSRERALHRQLLDLERDADDAETRVLRLRGAQEEQLPDLRDEVSLLRVSSTTL